MCRPLTVRCDEGHHTYTFEDIILPCMEVGSFACKIGLSELADFQNASTSCICAEVDHEPDCVAYARTCEAVLKKYGESLARGPRKKSWVVKWFAAKAEEQDWQKLLEKAHEEEVGGGLLTRKESDGALEALRRVRLDVRGEKE
ncbi:uncharacterized protein MYCFIDRAFT_197770 [Pseudocercospora fijiensis CIRAD86]|uniref:Uncharacterized protein n=1 Tax=Pseudocercospora fijiensis (strain CIRAD86) TaxID=383855 RepID=M3AUR7_PSEFD|nr:uncharacterized protein MYCFIDRAFT_197770 [Pseudocercospora fijiensis CIRAD86]EME80898.1 hypothetical protein MYCFIDRAFT_197770 [Pseudocercospora fijiensis CIRAD86]